MSDSTEFVVHRSVTQANPSLVSTNVWHRNATQMGANGRANQYLRTDVWGKRYHWLFIQKCRWSSRITLFDFALSESSDENNFSVPGGLQDLTWWKLWNIEFFIGVSDISSSGYHLVVHGQENSLQSNHVWGEDEPLQHVHLGSSDFVVSVGLVPNSVFVEPVVNLGLGVNRIAEVRWSGWGHPVGWSFGTEDVIYQFFILSFVIFLNDSEVSDWRGYTKTYIIKSGTYKLITYWPMVRRFMQISLRDCFLSLNSLTFLQINIK